MNCKFFKNLTVSIVIIGLIFGPLNILGTKKVSAFILPVQPAFETNPVLVGGGTSSTLTLAEAIAQTAAKIAGQILKKLILDRLVDALIEWIDRGGEGAIIEDWGQFFRQVGNEAIGEVLADIEATKFLCSPFHLQIQLMLLPVPKFSQRAKCTLDDIKTNLTNFLEDFRQGNWLTYQEMWRPQNNFYGAIYLTLDEVLRKQEEAKEAAKSEAQANRGFLSFKKCEEDPATKIKTCRIMTPGSLVAEAATESLIKIPSNAIINADDIASYITAILDAALNKLTKVAITGIKKQISEAAATIEACTGLSGNAKLTCEKVKKISSYRQKQTRDERRNINLSLLDQLVEALPQQQKAKASLNNIIGQQQVLANKTSDYMGTQCVANRTTNSVTIPEEDADMNIAETKITVRTKNLDCNDSSPDLYCAETIKLNKYQEYLKENQDFLTALFGVWEDIEKIKQTDPNYATSEDVMNLLMSVRSYITRSKAFTDKIEAVQDKIGERTKLFVEAIDKAITKCLTPLPEMCVGFMTENYFNKESWKDELTQACEDVNSADAETFTSGKTVFLSKVDNALTPRNKAIAELNAAIAKQNQLIEAYKFTMGSVWHDFAYQKACLLCNYNIRARLQRGLGILDKITIPSPSGEGTTKENVSDGATKAGNDKSKLDESYNFNNAIAVMLRPVRNAISEETSSSGANTIISNFKKIWASMVGNEFVLDSAKADKALTAAKTKKQQIVSSVDNLVPKWVMDSRTWNYRFEEFKIYQGTNEQYPQDWVGWYYENYENKKKSYEANEFTRIRNNFKSDNGPITDDVALPGEEGS